MGDLIGRPPTSAFHWRTDCQKDERIETVLSFPMEKGQRNRFEDGEPRECVDLDMDCLFLERVFMLFFQI